MGQVSSRKLKANRENALQSTGPRTPEGKGRVRWNSLQHGLLAQEVIIPTGPGQEDHTELEDLLIALRDDLQPSGALEEILVEKIAVCYWRLRRVLRSENGEIRSWLGRRASLVPFAAHHAGCVCYPKGPGAAIPAPIEFLRPGGPIGVPDAVPGEK